MKKRLLTILSCCIATCLYAQTFSFDGTDKTAKMDISIDEILKRKVRKGEWIES